MHWLLIVHSWSEPVGHVSPATHSVEPVTPPVPMASDPQQIAPEGHVSDVHD